MIKTILKKLWVPVKVKDSLQELAVSKTVMNSSTLYERLLLGMTKTKQKKHEHSSWSGGRVPAEQFMVSWFGEHAILKVAAFHKVELEM